ncbi:hypothetical protein, partial [Lacticaseibacillus paracasei]|uniref:hypothetical protein n=2 Tax=Lacticaseibacillus paracasei TaxID=1597 RepID=UPI002989B90A
VHLANCQKHSPHRLQSLAGKMVTLAWLSPFLPAVFEAAFDVTGTPATAENARVSVAKVAKICGVFFAEQNFARSLFFLLELLRNLFLSSFVAG